MSKILVIEDEELVRQFILCVLGMQEFDVVEAPNGKRGVERALESAPDLILCDVNMPELDGYGVLQQLKANPATAGVPFVFLSAAAERADVRHGMQLGADDYLTKPFTVAELLATVNTQLRKRMELQKRSEEKLEELRTNISLALPHELLTPLNGILGYAALLMEDADALDADEVLDCAKCIDASARRLHRLIENFMIYTQIELVQADPAKAATVRSTTPLKTAEMVRSVTQQKAEKSGRAADLQLDSEEASVLVRADYLAKIVEELTDNALKFSKAGSAVSVSSGPAGAWYCLEISDQGRGMTAEQIGSIGAHMQFDRRLHEQQGFGLGLVIAKKLAELHGGEFHITSGPEQGTRIRLLLPLAGGGESG